jgi:hypothetical protein
VGAACALGTADDCVLWRRSLPRARGFTRRRGGQGAVVRTGLARRTGDDSHATARRWRRSVCFAGNQPTASRRVPTGAPRAHACMDRSVTAADDGSTINAVDVSSVPLRRNRSGTSRPRPRLWPRRSLVALAAPRWASRGRRTAPHGFGRRLGPFHSGNLMMMMMMLSAGRTTFTVAMRYMTLTPDLVSGSNVSLPQQGRTAREGAGGRRARPPRGTRTTRVCRLLRARPPLVARESSAARCTQLLPF